MDYKPELTGTRVDLASGCWADNGTSQITFDSALSIFTEIIVPAIPWPDNRRSPSRLAKSIDDYARANGIRAVGNLMDHKGGGIQRRRSNVRVSAADVNSRQKLKARPVFTRLRIHARNGRGLSSVSRCLKHC